MPSWPKEWNVNFKLHAPGKTIIEGEYTDGKYRSIKVTPSTRKQDIMQINKD
jgi:hypothetical protein